MNNMVKTFNRFCILLAYPLLTGCIGGGGSSSVSGAGFADAVSGGGSGSLATIHNPEPTTMLLMGGGMMAMAYYRNKMKK